MCCTIPRPRYSVLVAFAVYTSPREMAEGLRKSRELIQEVEAVQG